RRTGGLLSWRGSGSFEGPTPELRVWVGVALPPRPAAREPAPFHPATRVGELRVNCGWGRSRRCTSPAAVHLARGGAAPRTGGNAPPAPTGMSDVESDNPVAAREGSTASVRRRDRRRPGGGVRGEVGVGPGEGPGRSPAPAPALAWGGVAVRGRRVPVPGRSGAGAGT